MSSERKSLVASAFLREFDFLRNEMKEERHIENGRMVPFALAGVLLASRNDAKAGSNRTLNPIEKGVSQGLFRTAMTNLARKMVDVHPELIPEIRNHKWIQGKLNGGPLGRLPEEEGAVKALRILLKHPPHFETYQEQGFFDWDDGDARGVICIVYGWQNAVVKHRPPTFTPAGISDAESILEQAIHTFPDHPIIRLSAIRYQLAWTELSVAERNRLLEDLLEMSDEQMDHLYSDDLRFAALSMTLDTGFRFNRLDLVDRALDRLTADDFIEEPSPRMDLERAWRYVQAGNSERAAGLALRAADGTDVDRLGATEVLLAAGESKMAIELAHSLCDRTVSSLPPALLTQLTAVET